MTEELDPRIHEQLHAYDDWEDGIMHQIRELGDEALGIRLFEILREPETGKVKMIIRQGQALNCNSLDDFVPLKDLKQKLREAGLNI